MGSLNRTQKIILIVLAVLDVLVIGGMAAVVISTSLRQPPPSPLPPPTQVAVTTGTAAPTWTPTLTTTPRPTIPPRPTNTPTQTPTPYPTRTPTSTPTPIPPGPVTLNGADFDFLLPNRIPGWEWDAYVNYRAGEEGFDPEASFAEPFFAAADDPARRIDGSTLKIETVRWVKFRAWVHQTVTITGGTIAQFQIKANAFSSLDRIIVKAGIDPTGPGHCYDAQWGEVQRINQQDGTVLLTSPRVVVPVLAETPEATATVAATTTVTATETTEETEPTGPLGRVTLCFYAEPTYPHVNNAAFFDQAELIVAPPP
jgi:septal ring-binding cell division protein DamX